MKEFTQDFTRFIYTAAFALILASCGNDFDNVENRGYMTKLADFSKIKPGISTKSDVIQTLGSPSTTSMFGSETWFYIGKEQTHETFFEPEVKNYEAYQITFNKAGVVSSVDKKDKSSLKAFDTAEDFTRTSGKPLTIWQQLLGNIGRFTPADRSGGTSPGVTPGSQKPRGY